MHIDNWIKEVKAKGGVDRDGHYGKQCMDLYNDYCDRVLGLKGNTGADYAKLILNNSYILKHCKKIKNYLDFVPQKGDIAVWTGGQYGHVAIVRDNKSDINILRTIDQNWVSQKLTEENHNYIYMAPLYFLRPLDQSNIEDKKEKPKAQKTFKVRVDKSCGAMVRVKPNTKAALGGSKFLNKGDVFVATEVVKGEKVNGNDKWYHSQVGNYVWSGGLTKI